MNGTASQAQSNARPVGWRGAAGQVRWLWLSVAIIVIDQLTKIVISGHIALFDSVRLLPFFQLTLLHNYGAAFSFLSGASGWQRWFFITLGLIVSIVILLWLRRLPRHSRRLLGVGLALVLGGALGNVIGRVIHGYVVDFFDFFHAGWHFPPFNVADAAITVGAILVILDTLIEGRRGRAAG